MIIKELSPDLILTNGQIYTLDPRNTRAQAIAIKDGCFQAIGADGEISASAGTNPYISLYALVTRKNRLGQLVAPDQAVSRTEALHAYTTAGTWLTREEQLKGAIEIGQLADLAVLDRDYFTVPEEQIKDIETVMTIAGGRVVWQKASDTLS